MNSELLSLKLDLINWISSLDDLDILNSIKELQNGKQVDWWEDLSSAQKDLINKGLEDVKEGRIHSHNEVTKLFDKWIER